MFTLCVLYSTLSIEDISKIFKKNEIQREITDFKILTKTDKEGEEMFSGKKMLVFLSKLDLKKMIEFSKSQKDSSRFNLQRYVFKPAPKGYDSSLYLSGIPSTLTSAEAKEIIFKHVMTFEKYNLLHLEDFTVFMPEHNRGFSIINFNKEVHLRAKCYLKAMLNKSQVFQDVETKCSWKKISVNR